MCSSMKTVPSLRFVLDSFLPCVRIKANEALLIDVISLLYYCLTLRLQFLKDWES